MKVRLPCLPRWREKMLSGVKVCTSRREQCGDVGDTFVVFGVTFEITDVVPETLLVVSRDLYIAEGCESPEEFVEVWAQLHPYKGFVPKQTVYVHWFRKVSKE